MDWLCIAFFVLAAWVTLTVLSNERRRLIESTAPAAPAEPAAGVTAPAHH